MSISSARAQGAIVMIVGVAQNTGKRLPIKNAPVSSNKAIHLMLKAGALNVVRRYRVNLLFAMIAARLYRTGDLSIMFLGGPMSTNCIRCIKNKRTGSDLLCDACRKREMELEEATEMRDELKWFAEQQETVLKENDHKGGWENESDEYLFICLLREISELYEAMNDDFNLILKECCDVANFAMMLADNNKHFQDEI